MMADLSAFASVVQLAARTVALKVDGLVGGWA